jgi:hypothetical protein
MGEERKVYKVLVGKPEGRRPLERPRCRWEDGFRMDVREIGLRVCRLDSTGSGQGSVAGCCECGDEPSGSCATELVNTFYFLRENKRRNNKSHHFQIFKDRIVLKRKIFRFLKQLPVYDKHQFHILGTNYCQRSQRDCSLARDFLSACNYTSVTQCGRTGSHVLNLDNFDCINVYLHRHQN